MAQGGEKQIPGSHGAPWEPGWLALRTFTARSAPQLLSLHGEWHSTPPS